MTSCGGTAPVHRARLLRPRLLDGVDLVLTAERAHRSAVLQLRPDLLRRTFTFLELVQLAEAVRPGAPQGAELTALAAVVGERGRHRVDDVDLADPVDGGPVEHEQMVRTVLQHGDRLLTALRGPAHPPG